MRLDNLLDIVANKLRGKKICVRSYIDNRLEIPVSFGEYSNLITIIHPFADIKVKMELNCGEKEIYDKFCELGRDMGLSICPSMAYSVGKDKKIFYYPKIDFKCDNNLDGCVEDIYNSTLKFITVYEQVMKGLQEEKFLKA